MSLLHLGTQDRVDDVYQNNGEFDWNRLDQHMEYFEEKYRHDPSLVNSVKGLLNKDEGARTGFENSSFQTEFN